MGVSLNCEDKSNFHFTVSKNTREALFSHMKPSSYYCAGHSLVARLHKARPWGEESGGRDPHFSVRTTEPHAELQVPGHVSFWMLSSRTLAYQLSKYQSKQVSEHSIKGTKMLVITWPKLNLLKWIMAQQCFNCNRTIYSMYRKLEKNERRQAEIGNSANWFDFTSSDIFSIITCEFPIIARTPFPSLGSPDLLLLFTQCVIADTWCELYLITSSYSTLFNSFPVFSTWTNMCWAPTKCQLLFLVCLLEQNKRPSILKGLWDETLPK